MTPEEIEAANLAERQRIPGLDEKEMLASFTQTFARSLPERRERRWQIRQREKLRQEHWPTAASRRA